MQSYVLYGGIAICMAAAVVYYRRRGPERLGWLIGIPLAGLAALLSPRIILLANSMVQTIALFAAITIAIILVAALSGRLLAVMVPRVRANIEQRKADKEKEERLAKAEKYWERKEAEKLEEKLSEPLATERVDELAAEAEGVINIEEERNRRKLKKPAFSEEYFYEESEPLEAESAAERLLAEDDNEWLKAAAAESAALETEFAIEHETNVTEAQLAASSMGEAEQPFGMEASDIQTPAEITPQEDFAGGISAEEDAETAVQGDISAGEQDETEAASGYTLIETFARAEAEAAAAKAAAEPAAAEQTADMQTDIEQIETEQAADEQTAMEQIETGQTADERTVQEDINTSIDSMDTIIETEQDDIAADFGEPESITAADGGDLGSTDELNDIAMDLLDKAWQHRDDGEYMQALQAYDAFCSIVHDGRLLMEVHIEELATMISAGMVEAASDKVFEILSYGEEITGNEKQQVIKALEYLQNI